MPLLKEIGDFNNVEAYPFKVMGMSTEFKTEKDQKVSVDISRMYDPRIKHQQAIINPKAKRIDWYNIEYSVEGAYDQAAKTNFGYLIKILSTVASIIKETVIRNDSYADDYQNIYCIGSFSKRGLPQGDKQKDMIYLLIGKKHTPPGYRMSDITYIDLGIDGFALTKDKF